MTNQTIKIYTVHIKIDLDNARKNVESLAKNIFYNTIMFINLNKNIYTHVKNSEKSREKKTLHYTKNAKYWKTKKIILESFFFKTSFVLY